MNLDSCFCSCDFSLSHKIDKPNDDHLIVYHLTVTFYFKSYLNFCLQFHRKFFKKIKRCIWLSSFFQTSILYVYEIVSKKTFVVL
jgi:hypothetical protein